MDKKRIAIGMLGLMGIALFGACDAGDSDEQPFSEFDVEDDLDEVFIVTRVEVTETGIGNVQQWETTRRAQLAEAEMERSRELGDVGEATQEVVGVIANDCPLCACNVSDFRIYSNANYTGAALCAYGSGTLNLGSYSFGSPSTTWAGYVESFKVGGYVGYLKPAAGSPPCGGASYVDANDPSWTGSSNYLQLGASPCIFTP